MASDLEKLGPNIKIQIQNNLAAMDVDEPMNSGSEEGEISDDNETEVIVTSISNITAPVTQSKSYSGKLNLAQPVFTTGINIFEKAEQEKLQERAKRFALKPEEVKNFTEDDLQKLYDSLGINSENEANVRFEAIHMLGIEDMGVDNIFDYFRNYAPTGIEYIDESSCNVFWTDNITAARAMYYTSQVVKGMPAREPPNPFAKEFLDDVESDSEENTGRSILLKNSNREIELRDDESDKKAVFNDGIDISTITIPIPPGYWRLGVPHPKSKCILLRYAFKTDKKPYSVEKFVTAVKKPSFAVKGIISESKKKEMRGIFERNKDIKNPWGILAKNWNKDTKYCEKVPEYVEEEKEIEIKNPNLIGRLGIKRKAESDSEIIIEESDVKEKPKAKTKIPRMRMYADEEEEKMKRKKILNTIKKQTKLIDENCRNTNDLRNILATTNRYKSEVVEPEIDLGIRLKNRNKKMKFVVEHDLLDETDVIEDHNRHEKSRDVRSIIDGRRAKSPHRRNKSPVRFLSPGREIRQRSPELRRGRNRERSPYHHRKERTLHSDRMPVNRSRRRSSSDYDDELSHKPKSKIAVVIKTQKKPTVASRIWSRPHAKTNTSSGSSSESESESESSSSSSSSSESSEEDANIEPNEPPPKGVHSRLSRPGFDKSRLMDSRDHLSPLKIEINNELYKK